MARDRGPDYVAEACAELARYHAATGGLIGLPSAEGGGPSAAGSRPAIMPEPYGQPGVAHMDAHEGVRRLEASLRLEVTGSPGRRRGGSDANTSAALDQVARLASQITGPAYSSAARHLDRWITEARAVHGIDELARYRRLPRVPGEALPPRCPYCGCYQMVADMDAGVVRCAVPGCTDAQGREPVASMGTDEHGRPCVTWTDGRVQAIPDLDR